MLLYAGRGIPLVIPPEDANALADWLEAEYPEEFCASASFEPDFIEALCVAGFIPMATRGGDDEFLIPKMHTLRSVMAPRDMVVSRTARRESLRYRFDLDTRFDEVLQACVETHGDDWLRRPLRESWLELFASRGARSCRFASMELYARDIQAARDILVAGEIGVFVGTCYTSLTGFRRESGSGTVQLASTARYLEAVGVTLWDLGMPLDYKSRIGARNVQRGEFLSLFRAARSVATVAPPAPGPYSARELIDRVAPFPAGPGELISS